MQNSLDRLLAGIAATLADEVAPALSDPYLRAQATTAAELLRTLAPRITWDLDAVQPWAGELVSVAGDAALPVDGDPEASMAAHLTVLAELARAGDERVAALVDAQVENERSLLRKTRGK